MLRLYLADELRNPAELELLVWDLVRLLLPGRERCLRFFAKNLLHLNRTPGTRQRQFAVNECVIKADLRCVSGSIGVINDFRARPVYEAHAHRARLAACIDFALVELKGLQLLAGGANSDDLRMRAGIIRRKHLVCALADDASILDHYGAKWSAIPGMNIVNGKLNRSPHELWIQSSPEAQELRLAMIVNGS